MKKTLPPIISVKDELCVNCHKCISVCPIKYCNDASGDVVQVNADMCIGCGQCIKSCDHLARTYIDDTQSFLADLNRQVPMVAIVAPAAASNFPNQYMNLNGWLKRIGVEAIFDVSFGAELTVKSYLEHIKSHHPPVVIAQPCPALVTYIQIYQPELLPYLAPADSPMMHTMKMIRSFYPQYEFHKIVVISPCIAKKRELQEVGIGDYNVTFTSLNQYFQEKRVNLDDFPEVQFTSAEAERAVLFSTPGGLMRTAAREFPDIAQHTRKIEGPTVIYDYFKKLPQTIADNKQPMLIDCLNCEMGCNGGTGTLSIDKSPDEVEWFVEKRNEERQAYYRSLEDRKVDSKGTFNLLKKAKEKTKDKVLNKSLNVPRNITDSSNLEANSSKESTHKKLATYLNQYWEPGLYKRSYTDHRENNAILQPNDQQIKSIYASMDKYSEKDIYNCSSCGYGSCERMAVAIYNKLNLPKNCYHFLLNEHKMMEEQSRHNEQYIIEKHAQLIQLAKSVSGLIKKLDSSNTDLVDMAGELYQFAKEQIQGFLRLAIEVQSHSNLTKSLEPIVESISKIAEKTKVLSINASIEAARASEYGRGFKVVANEIGSLAKNSLEEVAKIKPVANNVKEAFALIQFKLEEYTKRLETLHKLSEEVVSTTIHISESSKELDQNMVQMVMD